MMVWIIHLRDRCRGGIERIIRRDKSERGAARAKSALWFMLQKSVLDLRPLSSFQPVEIPPAG